MVTETLERKPGLVDQCGIDVIGVDIRRAESVAQQRCVVAGSGADLQDPVVILRGPVVRA
jgi:hypothetical protein